MDDNSQMPPVQPMNSMDGMPQNEVEKILASQGAAPDGMPQGQVLGGVTPQGGPMPQGGGTMPPVIGPDGRPMVQQPLAPPPKRKSTGELVKTIVIIFLSLLAVTFIGLFIWMTVQYNDEKNRDLDSEIAEAVAEARNETATKLEADFLEREKDPYRTFAGPIDYGELSFEYPKTWSVYVAAAATAGGDFNAYFNPIQVDAVGKETINALRVTILNKSFEDVTAEYQKNMERKDSNLTMESVTVAGVSANRYTGTIPSTDLSGIIVIFKIRDKTVIMQTDSMSFQGDFDRLLGTVTFND